MAKQREKGPDPRSQGGAEEDRPRRRSWGVSLLAIHKILSVLSLLGWTREEEF